MSTADVDPALQGAYQLHRSGKIEEAERAYLEILERRPEHAPALNLLGMLAGQTRRGALAVEILTRATTAAPANAEYHNNLGNALLMQGRAADAIKSFERAVQLRPDFSEVRRNLGVALNMTGRREEALAAFHAALAADPANLAARLNLGNLLHGMGRLDEGANEFRAALRQKPDYFLALNNLGIVLAAQGRLVEAIDCYRRAVTLNPDYAQAQSNLIYTLHLDPKSDDAGLQRELQFWSKRFAEPLAAEIRLYGNSPDPRRRLRIGYVSPDFRQHAVARFLVDVLAAHDPSHYEIHCFSDVYNPDVMTERLKSHAAQWYETSGMSDAQLADLVRASAIDILVDLSSHTAGSRLRVFARKPAPVQVTYLAYCSTTGIKAIDYRLTDGRLDPPAELPPYYSETSISLPETYWCYSVPPEAPEPNALPARARGSVTFGCLNSLSKISDVVLKTWIDILRAVPTSRLLLHADAGSGRERLTQIFSAAGVDPKRCEFVAYLPLEDYFRTLQKIDIALDPFPFAGGTTTCDALYMGVPVITLRGRRAVGRGGVSLLTSLSLLELIANTTEQYVQLATRLAGDYKAMANYRSGLRGMMKKSALMNPERFTRKLEEAYRRMWTTWCGHGQSS